MDKDQIKEMADKLAKSYEENENLKEFSNLVKEVGREGVETVIKSLPEESQIAFAEALTKAMSLDAAAKEKHGAKIKQVESEDARDEDEEAAKKRREADKGENLETKGGDTVKHQGDNSELSGQVIKSEDTQDELEKGEMEYEMDAKDAVKEHKEIVSDLKSGDPKKIAAQAKKQAKELDGMEVKKSEELDKGAFKELALEELEKGELLEKMIEKMRKRGMDHDVCMAALKKKGYDTDMAKGKWEAQQKAAEDMAKEDKQEDVKKSEAVQIEEAVEVIEKSVNWDSPNKRLEAHARTGQNTHIDVDGYLVKQALDKAAGPQKEEVLEKSETESEISDINDIIEKGYDRSIDQVKQAVGHVQKDKEGSYNTQSFSDEDLAKSMQMSVEEMHTVLGTTPVKETPEKKS